MDFKDFLNRLEGEVYISILTSMMGEEVAGEGAELIRLLIKHGCPTKAIIEAIAEFAEKRQNDD